MIALSTTSTATMPTGRLLAAAPAAVVAAVVACILFALHRTTTTDTPTLPAAPCGTRPRQCRQLCKPRLNTFAVMLAATTTALLACRRAGQQPTAAAPRPMFLGVKITKRAAAGLL